MMAGYGEGYVAGIDEVGRGPLAGPVVAAAVILHPLDPLLGKYRDSKKLSEARRLVLYRHLRRRAVGLALAQASVEEIDRLNILEATMLAMRRAVEALPVPPARAVVDGDRCPLLSVPVEAIVGGDDMVQEIAAASIVAKVVRDRLMQRLDHRYPGYGLGGHKGYGTAAHIQALQHLGPSPVHRQSFAPVAKAMSIRRHS
jgi:ribonuclease HII